MNGTRYALEMAKAVGAERSYLKGGSPSCEKEGVTGELLTRAGFRLTRVS